MMSHVGGTTVRIKSISLGGLQLITIIMNSKSISALLSSLILFTSADCQPDQCTQYGDVRLVGGSGDYEGNVQVCIGGTWGYVCDNSWSTSDARVVCKQLGYSTSYIQTIRNSLFGSGNGKVHMDSLYCSSSASNLTECSRGSILCNPYSDIAGVMCISGKACTNGTIRLINVYSYLGRSEGRVEVCYNNQWSTICDNNWDDDTNTAVVCTQLGYNGNYSIANYYSFVPISYPIAFTNVNCKGDETSLFKCSKSIVDNTVSECSHSQGDVDVRCQSVDDSPCVNGNVRLWSAYDDTQSNEGMVQICRGGSWYAMCDTYYSSTCHIGRIVCKSLGYSGAHALSRNAGLKYGYYDNNDDYRYSCYSYYTSLDQCYKYSSYGCGSVSDALGVVCQFNESEVASECTNGEVRLVNGGEDNEGRVEYCYEGLWSPMCSIDTVTAQLLCKELGFDHYRFAVIDSSETFGISSIRSAFNRLYCYSYAISLSQCTVSTKSAGCYVGGSTCSTEYGLTCLVKTDNCSDGEIRLNGGLIEQEGQAEICFDGVWGAICDSSWSTVDGYIFCKSLGYEGPNPTIYYNAIFGITNVFPVWNYLNCYGWERSIYDCSKRVYPSNLYCSSRDAAGVLCKDDCQDGDVRLSDGEYDNEGTVEICRNNLWGQISDASWTDANARVVCRSLGFNNIGAIAVHDSFYGMANLTIHFRDVTCVGYEHDITQCAVTANSLYTGKKLLGTVDVAGVDCIYDAPTPLPCIVNPNIDPSNSCTNEEKSSVRLIKNGVENTTEGRVEYCNGQYWTPLCNMDNKLAAVACRELGHRQYSWGAIIENGDYGVLLNYSLVQNITCSSGFEASISDCTVNDAPNSCLPWCPNRNIGLRCFTDNSQCTEGDIRLVDGIIEQEGRVEVCVNGVWGSICDDTWDKTDAHVVCRQMGHPELEPYVYRNTQFGDGEYPIVYSNVSCGGWEDDITHCKRNDFKDTICSRQHVAGVLCGYDCKNGEVRLIDGPSANEGTVTVCHDNIWGLVDESGWSLSDAKVICSQLGYSSEEDAIIARAGSYYGKSNKPIYLSNIGCNGDEDAIEDCTQTTYSLKDGKTKLATVNVAGVRCSVSDNCVTPPTGGTECDNGQVRLTGGNSDKEGFLEYCHKGFWSPYCSLNQTAATVACRQLGHTRTEFVSIFDDGRFNEQRSTTYTSYIEYITCSNSKAGDLSQCHVIDGCEVSCNNPIAIKCFEPDNCEDGAVRLTDGLHEDEGRIEICYKSVWGSVCGTNFDFMDGLVGCKSSGISEPVVSTNSHFGDGNQPILFSNIECSGSEESLHECNKTKYGKFSCSRQNIAGLKCKDDCEHGSIRLSGGISDSEGTVEVCYKGLWGLVAAEGWSDRDASVVCQQLGYEREDAVGFNNSRYGRPNVPVLINRVFCFGTEDTINDCFYSLVPVDEGRLPFNVSGVSCLRSPQATFQPPQNSTQSSNNTVMSIAVGFLGVILLIAIAIIIGMVVLNCIRSKPKDISIRSDQPVSMSSINPIGDTISETVSIDEKIIPF